MTPSRQIAEMFLPVPEHNELFEQAVIGFMEFTSTSKHVAAKQVTEMQRGRIGVALGWAQKCITTDGCQYSANNSKKPIIQSTKETIQQWYNDQILDPMDPDASSLVEVIERNQMLTSPTNENMESNVFRLNEDLTAFCSEQELQSNKRLNMLSARFNADLKFKNLKFVPNNEREIHGLMVADDDNDDTDDGGGGKHIIEDLDWMDPIDLQRHRGKKYLRSVYQLIMNHCDILNKNCEAQDLLIGDGIPTIR